MITTAFVKLWGENVGAIAWNSDTALASFEYDPKFINKNWDLAAFVLVALMGQFSNHFKNDLEKINLKE